ncbi:MAG: zinc ribbon domain-containing protein [Myxococcales bacterium]|nr:zinc ribbon domain-containing protein [Myxococcales bacterium]
MASSIRCPSCRHDNDSWRKHCGGCGSGLPGGCVTCGAVNSPTDRFCGGCARALRRTAREVKPANDSTMPIDVLTDLIPDTPRR